VVAALFAAGSAWAAPGTQPSTPPDRHPPRLLAPVAPDYPPEAPDGAHGDVSLRVTVDESGRVVDVAVVDGPSMFQPGAIEAARQLRFAPGHEDGVPVPMAVLVRFHFEPPVELEAGDAGAAEIVVAARSADDRDTHARHTLDEAALDRRAGEDLASTVSEVPGVVAAGGSTEQSKPVIRGQTERRLLLLYDGVRHESQKWGPDHAPEIDPFSAGAVSVIKGAAGVRYGPDAIGGVILVAPPPMRTDPGVGGKAMLQGATNGRQGLAALRLDLVPDRVPELSVRAEGSYRRGASLQTPDYILGNTGSEQWTAGVSARLGDSTRSVRASFHHFDLRAGIFYDISSESPADFQARLERDRPLTADLWSVTYDIDRPYQAVSHDRATLHAHTDVGETGGLDVVYAYQHNHRQEYESVRGEVETPQYDFVLRTHSLDGVFRHGEAWWGAAELSGEAGLQGTFQENVYTGYSLLPNHRAAGGGVFLTERLSWHRVDLEAGARHDRLGRSAWFTEDDFARHERRGTLAAADCDTSGVRVACPTAYGATSVSLGGLWRAVPDTMELKLDLSSASRVPNADELYIIGSAPSFPVFGLGSPDLGVETTFGSSLTAALTTLWVDAELSGYANHSRDYIYFAPDVNDAGEPRYEVTIQGTWPRYASRAIDARFVGADGGVQIAPTSLVGLDLSGAIVRARDVDTGAFLVGTPADRARVSLVGRPAGPAWMQDARLSVFVDIVGEQTRTDPRVEFAAPPDGYTLLGASADMVVPTRMTELSVGLSAHNLTNVAYRDYTSLLRFFADQPGRDLRLRVGATF
jgi:iron complex outermembrane receptor protein